MPKAPKTVRSAARRALERRRKRAKQTRRPGGTAVGVARARDLSSGRSVSKRTLKRMLSFFARHDTKSERAARRRNSNSPAAIAWGLWGGTAGRAWAKRELAKLEQAERKKARTRRSKK